MVGSFVILVFFWVDEIFLSYWNVLGWEVTESVYSFLLGFYLKFLKDANVGCIYVKS